MESDPAISGSIKSDMTRKADVFSAMCALKFTCTHEERACYSMLICLPVESEISRKLSLKVCPSCAIYIAEQVLEGLENTYPRRQIGKSGSECLDWPTSSDKTI